MFFNRKNRAKIKEYKMRTKNIPLEHRRSIFLLLTPEHNNLGDHAIAEAQKQFLSDYFPEYPLYEINYLHFQGDRLRIHKRITNNDIIVISGGGYLGDIWPNDDYMVRSIVEEYKDNQVVILPQTIYYLNKDSNTFMQDRLYYENHKNLLFCVRDTGSFELVQKLHLQGKSAVLYVPDMVLYWKTDIFKNKREKIGICFRHDVEKVLDDAIVDAIIKFVGEKDLVEFDTQLGYNVSTLERERELNNILELYSKLGLVITDRLHAMLFAAITNTPCIAFDNMTHKVTGVYPWIEHLEYVKIAKRIEDVPDYMKQLHQRNYCFERVYYKKEFDRIYSAMKERVK